MDYVESLGFFTAFCRSTTRFLLPTVTVRVERAGVTACCSGLRFRCASFLSSSRTQHIMDSATINPKDLKEKPKEGNKEEQKKAPVKAYLLKERAVTENTDAARDLYNQSRYGKLLADGRVQLALTEAMYLLERGKITVAAARGGKATSPEQFMKKAAKTQKNFWVKYSVFKDIRDRGYIIKTALKFGADFRIYDRGVKPGEDHARWILYPVHEGDTLTWHEFSAKNRVAHSTKKRLLIGVVDEEADVSYWEVRWMRP